MMLALNMDVPVPTVYQWLVSFQGGHGGGKMFVLESPKIFMKYQNHY